MPRIDEQAIYTILVQGPIDPGLADWCGPIEIVTASGDDGQVVTTLRGLATDQAGLMGVVRHLHGLGVILLSVTRGRLPEAAGTATSREGEVR